MWGFQMVNKVDLEVTVTVRDLGEHVDLQGDRLCRISFIVPGDKAFELYRTFLAELQNTVALIEKEAASSAQ